MIFKKALLLLTFLTVALPLFSQGKYALSYSDYMNNQWTTIDTLHIKSRSAISKMLSGGGDFKLLTGDKRIDDLLKNQAEIVAYKDTLYVNCRSLRCEKMRFGNWYARGFRFDNDKICFIAMTIGRSANEKSGAYGAYFGGIGGAIISATGQIEYGSCYILTSQSNEVERISSEYMENLLSDSLKLKKEYKALNSKKKESPSVILDYFKKLQLLNKPSI